LRKKTNDCCHQSRTGGSNQLIGGFPQSWRSKVSC
jgi:hypothetical protein